ncbi:MAG TPA: hypothetical protein P5084_06190 [Paludibacter sp.]|nr:hypothetical protein [Paludibacter sp.]
MYKSKDFPLVKASNRFAKMSNRVPSWNVKFPEHVSGTSQRKQSIFFTFSLFSKSSNSMIFIFGVAVVVVPT